MTTNLNPDQVEAMAQELTTIRATLDESEALVRYLRGRTVVLNNEVRNRGGQLAQRDQSIADLTRQLVAAERAANTSD